MWLESSTERDMKLHRALIRQQETEGDQLQAEGPQNDSWPLTKVREALLAHYDFISVVTSNNSVNSVFDTSILTQ